MRPGNPRFAWLKRLNTSMRNCSLADPDMSRFLITEKSVLLNRGPYPPFLTRFPKWTAPPADTGNAKTELDEHAPAPAGIRGSHTPLLNHCVTDPMIAGSP